MSILIFVLVILCFSCLFRVLRGPTIPDRMVAIDILGILVVGICGLLAIFTGRGFLMDIVLTWILLSFIGTLALAKLLSGRGFDE